MTHRIALKMAGALAAVSLVVLAPTAAHAGPSQQQPATKSVTKWEAHKVADYGVSDFMKGFPKPRHYEIGACAGHGNPKIQQCPVDMTAPGTHCTATVLVWEDADSFYWEWRHLRCSG